MALSQRRSHGPCGPAVPPGDSSSWSHPATPEAPEARGNSAVRGSAAHLGSAGGGAHSLGALRRGLARNDDHPADYDDDCADDHPDHRFVAPTASSRDRPPITAHCGRSRLPRALHGGNIQSRHSSCQTARARPCWHRAPILNRAFALAVGK